MSKKIAIAVLFVVGLVAVGGTAEARGRRCGASYSTTPYVAQSTDGGYRTYSYEPGMAPAPSYRSTSPYDRPFSGFHNAGWKITGR
jgi:hypothetical protein